MMAATATDRAINDGRPHWLDRSPVTLEWIMFGIAALFIASIIFK